MCVFVLNPRLSSDWPLLLRERGGRGHDMALRGSLDKEAQTDTLDIHILGHTRIRGLHGVERCLAVLG